MSTCISQHGEFSEHESSPDSCWYCRLCGEYDQPGLLDALKKAEAKVARVEALAEALAEVPDCTASNYDRGRVDQRHANAEELWAALTEPERDEEVGR